MAVRRFINKVLGRPAAFDVDAVRSVLEGRSQSPRADAFPGFNSPPVHVTAPVEQPADLTARRSTAEASKGSTKKKRKPVERPAPDRF
jgi:hypothetical protein